MMIDTELIGHRIVELCSRVDSQRNPSSRPVWPLGDTSEEEIDASRPGDRASRLDRRVGVCSLETLQLGDTVLVTLLVEIENLRSAFSSYRITLRVPGRLALLRVKA